MLRKLLQSKEKLCHPERSEGSLALENEILRYAQDDKWMRLVHIGGDVPCGAAHIERTNTYLQSIVQGTRKEQHGAGTLLWQ